MHKIVKDARLRDGSVEVKRSGSNYNLSRVSSVYGSLKNRNRKISRISGIPLSGYYYRPVKRHVQRLDPSTKERIKDIASESLKF